jgi:hypothetical protein
MSWWWLLLAVFGIASAGLLARFLVKGGVDNIGWLRRKHFEPWNGRYYEFATIHLRAAEHDDGSLVFVESDLLTVIGQPDSTTVKLFGPSERVRLAESGETALTAAGCERLLMKCPHPDAKKLLLFLQRECFKPYAKKRERIPA